MTRPAPKFTNPVMTRVTDGQLAALNAESEARQVPTADIVRDAIDFYLAATPPPVTVPAREDTESHG